MDTKYSSIGHVAVVIVTLLLVVVGCNGVHGEPEEPRCLSRFDYDYKIVQKLFELEQSITGLKDSLAKSQEHVKDMLAKSQEHVKELSSAYIGSVYIRWGRNKCHGNAKLVYKGFTAGKKHDEKGSGSDTICLPDDPSWFNYTTTTSGGRGYVYGTEIDVQEPSGVFEHPVNQQDLPCAVCHTRTSSIMMIPGRSHCYPGWKLEYAGYLMTAYYNHPGPHNHVCVDHHPESVPRGGNNDNQHILYLAVAKCGSLPCPPYVENQELACVVCSL